MKYQTLDKINSSLPIGTVLAMKWLGNPGILSNEFFHGIKISAGQILFTWVGDKNLGMPYVTWYGVSDFSKIEVRDYIFDGMNSSEKGKSLNSTGKQCVCKWVDVLQNGCNCGAIKRYGT